MYDDNGMISQLQIALQTKHDSQEEWYRSNQRRVFNAKIRWRISRTFPAPRPLPLPKTTTRPLPPARAVRPARCRKSAVFRGGSSTNTCDTLGSKSSPRARRDVLSSTRGASAPDPAAQALASEPTTGDECFPGRGLRNPARCLFEP